MLLSARNIHRKFSIGNAAWLHVLKGVSLDVDEGEIVAVVGPSGAGKSTLLHILGMLDRPSEGEVWLDGQEVFGLGDDQLAPLRNKKIGFVFQFHHLLPEFSALENVMMPALIGGIRASHAGERAQKLLREVGLENRLSHKPNELSGGEQQRVAVARALMNSPRLILADEPSGNLDTENAAGLHSMIFSLRSRFHQSFVIVTHNKDFAAMADRIVTIVDGVLDRLT